VEQIKLIALRDFAIQHLPRAQSVPNRLPYDQYQRTLYGIAALVPPTASAVEQVAAHLLQTTLILTMKLDDDIEFRPHQRQQAERQAVIAANELCTLTGTTIPWLAEVFDKTEQMPAPEQEEVATTPTTHRERPLLQPGPLQTTRDAARYLGVAEQTMRSWASKDDGPLRSVLRGRFRGWPTDELIRLGQSGWTPRGSK
jgi:hypothetical protein